MEIAILNFGCRTAVILNPTIEKTIEKCAEFYKGIHLVHNQCMIFNRLPGSSFPSQGRASEELAGEMYRVKQIEVRLKEIALKLSEFQRIFSEVVELVKNKLAWI